MRASLSSLGKGVPAFAFQGQEEVGRVTASICFGAITALVHPEGGSGFSGRVWGESPRGYGTLRVREMVARYVEDHRCLPTPH